MTSTTTPSAADPREWDHLQWFQQIVRAVAVARGQRHPDARGQRDLMVGPEIERLGAKRVLLTTTRSLTGSRLVREVTSALGDRCVGRFSDIHAHSPREAVIAGETGLLVRPRDPEALADALCLLLTDPASRARLGEAGRARAVADCGRVRFGGFVAWLAWLAIHIFYLSGFRNRVLVLISWAWSYLTFRRGARIITGVPALPEKGES